MHLYIEGCESQFFRFNRLSPGGAIIANKYMCLKGVRKKFGMLSLTRVWSWSDLGLIGAEESAARAAVVGASGSR